MNICICVQDVDEFLVLINNAAKLSIPQLLTQYSDYSGLAMNWRVIGSSGHKTKPKTSVLASYTHCLPTTDLYSRYVKMFVQPKYMTLMMVCRDVDHDLFIFLYGTMTKGNYPICF